MDTPGEPPAPPAFRLQTFGTLRLVGTGDDTVLGDHGHQRRRLALLAVVAASGERGRSRDQLLGLFWSDASQSRAQHSLGQLLYAIRTSLDGDPFTGTNPLRLNAAFIRSDIGDFGEALARGGDEAAVELYRGPFLDGFYLTDAPEFEHWMDAERGRVERSYTEALERLAKSAEASNDYAAAARWRQKLVDTDPVSSKHATDLIRALMHAGNHASALQYAERYEAIVAQELGTSVGPAVAALVAEVRQRAKTESVVVRGVAPRSRRPRDADASADASIVLSADDATTERSDAPVEASVTPVARPVSTEPPSVPAPGEPLALRGEAPVPRLGARRGLYAIAALAIVALVISVVWPRPRTASAPSTAAVDHSIAVLPLANLSGDARDAALVDGLTEELIGVLGKIDRLRVVSRTSAFVFRNSNLDVRRIADSLRVSSVLEGGVQRVGQTIRVQVRLVDGRDGSTRWSESYDRELKDIFLVQSDIATAVARELDVRIGAGTVRSLRRKPTEDIAAYELYLRGSDPANLRSDSGVRAGQEYFRQAIALDSTYAGAYAGLARMYQRLISTAPPGTSPRALHALARQTALKAVALDDSLAEAHASLGAVAMASYDFTTAERELKRALEIDPASPRTREWLTRIHHWRERPLDALAEANRAVESDPLSPSAHAELGRAMCAAGRYSQGMAELKRLETVRPPLLRVSGAVWLCHAMKGDWQAAIAHRAGDKAARMGGFDAFALARAGQGNEARSILAELTDHRKRTGYGAFSVAVGHAGLGERDEAFEWLDRSVDDFSLSWEIMLPLFDELHADARFQQLRRRLGLQNR